MGWSGLDRISISEVRRWLNLWRWILHMAPTKAQARSPSAIIKPITREPLMRCPESEP